MIVTDYLQPRAFCCRCKFAERDGFEGRPDMKKANIGGSSFLNFSDEPRDSIAALPPLTRSHAGARGGLQLIGPRRTHGGRPPDVGNRNLLATACDRLVGR